MLVRYIEAGIHIEVCLLLSAMFERFYTVHGTFYWMRYCFLKIGMNVTGEPHFQHKVATQPRHEQASIASIL